MEDNYQKDCEKCSKGKYVETCIEDDWDGILRCPSCGHVVPRYKKDK